MVWIENLWFEHDMAIEMWCVCVKKSEKNIDMWIVLKCEINTCYDLNERWWGKYVIVRLRQAYSLYYVWNLELSWVNSSNSGHMENMILCDG